MPDDVWIDVITNIDEIVEIFEDIQKDLIAQLKIMEDAVEKLEPIERSVLTMHYFEALPFQEISKKIPYSERSIYRIHAEALTHLKIPPTDEHDRIDPDKRIRIDSTN